MGALVGLMAGAGADAAAMAGPQGHGTDPHSLYCGCGDACDPESCCCGPSRPEEPSKPARPGPGKAGTSKGRNPCMKSAPCHESGVPVAGAVNPARESAAAGRGVRTPAGDDDGGVAFRMPRWIQLPPRRASRLDRPPDHPSGS